MAFNPASHLHVARDQIVGAMPPPPGQTANFVDPVSAGPKLEIMFGAFAPIAALFLAQRLYTKFYILHAFGSEDVSLIISWLFSLGVQVMAVAALYWGGGHHIWDVPMDKFIIYFRSEYAINLIYLPVGLFAKVAILLFYLRVSPKRSFHVAVWITLFTVTCAYVSILLALAFQCKPISKAWTLSEVEGTCINRPPLWIASAVVNVVTDVAILILPLPMLRKLQMPARHKIAIAFMFCLGSLTCVISIVRLQSLFPLLHNPDLTWINIDAGCWIFAEINLMVICGSMLTIKSFLRRHAPQLLSSSRGSSDRHPQDPSQRNSSDRSNSRKSRKMGAFWPSLHGTTHASEESVDSSRDRTVKGEEEDLENASVTASQEHDHTIAQEKGAGPDPKGSDGVSTKVYELQQMESTKAS